MTDPTQIRSNQPSGLRIFWGLAISLGVLDPVAKAGGDAPPILEDHQIVPSDGESSDNFGVSVSISGDTILIGAYFADGPSGPTDSGSAYVYLRTGDAWLQQAELLPSDPATGAKFGGSVAIDGDIAVIGAWQDDAVGVESGSAYVFVRNGTTWTQEAKLVAFDGSSGDWFGYSVSISGETVVVGADNDDDLGMDAGSAYVFVRNGGVWTLQTKLLASDGQATDSFGNSVSIAADTIIVGAPLNHGGPVYSGAAYVFVRSGNQWFEQTKLVASDAGHHDCAGESVSIDGDTVIVGAPCYEPDDRGAAYVFERNGSSWTETTRLPGSNLGPGIQFGTSVAVRGNSIAVGAPQADGIYSNSGAAYVFLRCGMNWIADGQRVASNTLDGDYFASRLALEQDVLVCTTPAVSLAGAAYVYVHSSGSSSNSCAGDGSAVTCPCGNNSETGADQGCLNSTGLGSPILAGGSPRVSSDAFRVHSCHLRPGQPALLFVGQNLINGGNGIPFGDGLRCAGGSVVRLGVKTPNAAGIASWGPGLGVPGGWAAGDVRYFQVWYRDPSGSPCGAGFNTSSALQVQFQL